MDPKIQANLDALRKQAKEQGIPSKRSRRRKTSLEEIIRTKEQADRFMKQLLSVSNGG